MNQIVSIIDPDQNTVTFTYDLTGKRLSKRIATKGKKEQIFRFFYLGETEIGCVDENGIIKELKIPSDPNNPEATSVAIEIKKETYVPIYDLQGNIACLLDSKRRKVVESYRYSVYGEEEIINKGGRVVSVSAVGNSWRYRGKRVDKELGLIYFGYRYYDPEVGRWISPDPAGSIDGPNLYAFVRNNPIKYVDYFGLNATSNEICGCVMHDHPGWDNAPFGCVCICGKDGVSGSAQGSCRSKIGSDIQKNLFLAGSIFTSAGIGDIFQTRSAPYEAGAKDLANGGIGFINGINNSIAEAQGHALMLSRYAQGAKIQGIYNASHHVSMDVVECIAGQCGAQMAPVQLLKNQWNHFISTHTSHSKFLQICHSGGAIHVKNALLTSPESVRQRIIALAIAPAAIIPKRLCYKTDNYISRRDFVTHLDVFGKIKFGSELHILEPHPNANLWDHEFVSPTFERILKDRIQNYIDNYGGGI